MSKIDPNANLYDIDGNLISKSPLENKTLSEVEQLVDDLAKKVEENPDNEVYKVYLNNANAWLFSMYNNMTPEERIMRINSLQDSIKAAKDKANEAEKEKLDKVGEALEQLKESYTEPVTESNPDEMDEYVQYEELPTPKEDEEIKGDE